MPKPTPPDERPKRGRSSSSVDAGGASDDRVRTLLGMISDELKSPLQTTLANADVLGLMPLSAEARGALERLDRSLNLALRRLDGVSAYVRSAGQDRLQRGVVSADEVVSAVCDECSSEARRHGQRFVVERSEFGLRALEGDPATLHRVLESFVLSATRHGREGDITIGYALATVATCSPAIEVTVSCAGLGIPFSERPACCRPLTVAHSDLSETEDMDLGHAIAKLLSDSAGWEVGVRRQDNITTVFFVRIPLETPPSATT